MKKFLLTILIFIIALPLFGQVNLRYQMANWPWDITIGTTGSLTVGGLVTLSDSLNLTGTLEMTDGTDTYNLVVVSDELMIQNDASTPANLVEIDSTGKFELNGLLDGDGTSATLNNTLADSLDITGELTATTIVVTGSITDGVYTSDGSGNFTGVTALTTTSTLTVGGLIDANGTNATTNNTFADSLEVTGNVAATTFGGITSANLLDKSATESVSGTYTFSGPPSFNIVTIIDTITTLNVISSDFIHSGLYDGNGTNATSNNTMADTLDITGELTATTIVTTGSITDGTYTSDGTGGFTGVASLTSTSLTTTAFIQGGVAVTNTDTFNVSAANSGKVHIIGDFAQNTLMISSGCCCWA